MEKLQIKVNAFIYGAETFYSAKTSKNYHKVSLLINKVSATFFVDDKIWPDVVKSKSFQSFEKSNGAPTPVVVVFDLRFNERGLTANVAGFEG